jgi:mannitol/fructose-specific phosphotransferase system IIA component (Ntr-type)
MKLLDTLDPQCICLLKHHSKEHILDELLDRAVQCGLDCNITDLKERLLYRERLMSTGIGLGIGIPHVRLEGVKEPIVALGLQPDGVVDYDSIDNLPVKLVFLILIGKEQHKQYLELLAHIVNVVKRRGVVDALLSAPDSEAAYRVLQEETNHV